MPVGFDAESRRADRLERPGVRAIPDGDLAGIPHRLRGGGRCAAGADGAGGRPAPAHARSRVPVALEAAGEGHQHLVRGRSGVRDGALVRAGPAVASLHGPIRRIDRAAVRARGLRVLHGGDLSGHLPLWARQGVARLAPALRRRRRGQRRGIGAFRHPRERVHERSPAAAPIRLAAMASPSWPYQVVHVLLSCYQATAWAMVAISGFILLRDPRRTLHRKALALALPVACLTALVQPLSGDRSAKHLAVAQPLKLAAAEAHLHTGRARAAARRRRSRSRHGRVPRRDSDPGRPVLPRVR